MSNPNKNFNQFLLYLKTHELKAPTFLASNHYFIKDTGESNTTFELIKTDEFVPSKIDFTSFLLPEDQFCSKLWLQRCQYNHPPTGKRI